MTSHPGADGARARARSRGARERERKPAEIRNIKGDVTTLQVEVAGPRNDLAARTKTMEKRVEEHNKDSDKNTAEIQFDGTGQLSIREKKFEGS